MHDNLIRRPIMKQITLSNRLSQQLWFIHTVHVSLMWTMPGFQSTYFSQFLFYVVLYNWGSFLVLMPSASHTWWYRGNDTLVKISFSLYRWKKSSIDVYKNCMGILPSDLLYDWLVLLLTETESHTDSIGQRLESVQYKVHLVVESVTALRAKEFHSN